MRGRWRGLLLLLRGGWNGGGRTERLSWNGYGGGKGAFWWRSSLSLAVLFVWFGLFVF